MHHEYLSTPIGVLEIVASEEGLQKVRFMDADEKQQKNELPHLTSQEIAHQAKVELGEYFQGKRKSFDVPLDAEGTDFQKVIWGELMKIPFGKTTSYGEIAQWIHQPTASRAIGMANGQNPIAIIVPCHRVIGASGDLTGYAGGMERKEWLLIHEGSLQKQLKLFG